VEVYPSAKPLYLFLEMLLNHERDGLDKRYMHPHSREQMRKALGEWAVKLNQAGENKKVY
jgi:hypothetical protein